MRVFMCTAGTRIFHVRDQADAAGPETRVFAGALHLLGEFRREGAEHGGRMHADLLEQPSAHHAHDTAAFVVTPGPRSLYKAPGLAGIEVGGGLILQRLEHGHDGVAQAFKPGARLCLAGFQIGHGRAFSRSAAPAPLFLKSRPAILAVQKSRK
jgi:hypothetical protein